jgi:bidirectional [NiFe] hydrogenase diaphorase subunit
MTFCQDESCGKCVPCRAGTVQLNRLLTRIIDKAATPQDLLTLEALCDMVRNASLCGLGQTAPNPVLSTLRYFREEYTSRIRSDSNGVVRGRTGLPLVQPPAK